MSEVVYKKGDKVKVWIPDGVASGWDRGEVYDIDNDHYVWVDTKTAGRRYYHQGDTEFIKHRDVVSQLGDLA